MERVKSLVGSMVGVTGLTFTMQQAEEAGKLIAIGLTIAGILFPLFWSWSDRRRKIRREEGTDMVAVAMIEIIQATTPAEMEQIRIKYLGVRSKLMNLPFNSEASRQFAADARKLIDKAWRDRLIELQPGTIPPPPTVPVDHFRR